MKSLILFIAFLLMAFRLDAQQSDEITRDSIDRTIMNLLPDDLQQTFTFIHADCNNYQPGELILAKLYQINKPDRVIEDYPPCMGLFNEGDSLVGEFAWTDSLQRQDVFLQLPDDIYPGYYTLAAYNCIDSSSTLKILCKKEIRIGINQDRVVPDYQVLLYPEGGYLLDDVMCRVAFEAVAARQEPLEISGWIEDAEGNRCATLQDQYKGIGSFSFIPQAGKKYFAVCLDKNNLQKKVPLPEVQTQAYALAALWRNGLLTVTRKSAGNKIPDKVQYLLLHTDNKILYWGKWNVDKAFFSFDKKRLGKGVLQLVLYDENLIELSRRAVFVPYYDLLAQTEVRVKSDQQRFYRQIVGEVTVTDSQGNPLQVDLSVAVRPLVEAAEVEESLWTAYNLSSFLRKHIAYPIEYLSSEKGFPSVALDNLMLTYHINQSAYSAKDQDVAKHIFLSAVEVSAPRERKKKMDMSYASFGDYSITRKDIEKRQWVDILQLFHEFPSVRVLLDGTLRIRSAQRPPLIVIDNIPLTYTTNLSSWGDNPPFDHLTVNDIERIDIISGNKAAIFGMNGGNGAVCITTRYGSDVVDQPIDLDSKISSENTLYWQSNLQTDEKGMAQFAFPILDRKISSVRIIIEGKELYGGKIVSYCKEIDL